MSYNDNLARLATYLESLPSDYANFDMGVFAHREGYDIDTPCEMTYECGTVACAVGHAPAAGIPAEIHDCSWSEYCRWVCLDWRSN